LIPFSRCILDGLRSLFTQLFSGRPECKVKLDHLIETYVETPLTYIIQVDSGASSEIKMAHTGLYFKVKDLMSCGIADTPIRVICQALKPPHLRFKSIMK
jgi:hypothetical protein